MWALQSTIALSVLLSLAKAQSCDCPPDYTTFQNIDDCFCCPGTFTVPSEESLSSRNYTGGYCCVEAWGANSFNFGGGDDSTTQGDQFSFGGGDGTTTDGGQFSFGGGDDSTTQDGQFSFGGGDGTTSSETGAPFCFDCGEAPTSTGSSSEDPFSFGPNPTATSTMTTTTATLGARNVHVVRVAASLMTPAARLRRDTTDDADQCTTRIPLTATDYSSLAVAAGSLRTSETSTASTTSALVQSVTGNAALPTGSAHVAGVVVAMAAAAAAALL